MGSAPKTCAVVFSKEQVGLLIQLCEAEINAQSVMLLDEAEGEIRDISIYNLEQIARKLDVSLL